MHIAGAVKQKLRRAKSADGSRNGGMEEHAAAAPVESGPPAGAADETPAAIIPRKAKAKNAPKKKTEKEKSVLDSLPHWLKPGVADETHVFLRVILLSLNAFLGYCAVVGVFRPHFEIMFVLSLGLTASYFFFMNEIAIIHREEIRKKAGAAAAGEGEAVECKKDN